MSPRKLGKGLHQGEHQGEAKCPKPGRADEKREGAWERQGEGRERKTWETLGKREPVERKDILKRGLAYKLIFYFLKLGVGQLCT